MNSPIFRRKVLEQFAESERLEVDIARNLGGLGYEC